MNSARFDYVPITIPLDCLRSLWSLTLSENEWGGRMQIDNNCRARCDGKLVEGSVISETVGPDSELYLGKDKAYEKGKLKPVRLASIYIPFDEYSRLSTCDGGERANLVFHTHPLLLVRDKDTKIARIAPPSLGDIFVHCLLATRESYGANGHAVCTVVVAFEGLYMYSVLPHRFRQFLDALDAAEAAGVAHDAAIDAQRAAMFDDLRPVNDRFFDEMKRLCDSKPDVFGTDGAPDIRDGLWSRVGATPDRLAFPYAEAIATPTVREFSRSNPFIHGLAEHGFHCEFHPAPFEQDLTLLAPSKITLLEDRRI